MFTDNYDSSFCFWVFEKRLTQENCFRFCKMYEKESIILTVSFQLETYYLRLRGIIIGHHFHANIIVQAAMCKDNNNSKSRAATRVKFDIYTR